ncbi:MAG: SUMF1/EgtB/PvdO family nonheme iron enzyme [Planctomycetes bacterium]|nr:SUMF1/EgtB/PvdO family nonheme iron enzyme [Planctomycetota bacterium]
MIGPNIGRAAAIASFCVSAASCGTRATTASADAGARGGYVRIQNGAAAPESYIDIIPGTAVKFELIGAPGGEIDLASAGKVRIAPFWIGKVEVSWDLFDMYVYGLEQQSGAPREKIDGVTYPSKPYISMDRSYGHTGYPAISMSFKNAQNFCAWLSAKTHKKYRLPIEAEWRFACAAGGAGEIPEKEILQKQAWLYDNSAGTTHPSASKAPNAFGLFDMIGNASEWAVGADGKPVTLGGTFQDSMKSIAKNLRTPPSDAWNASDPQSPKSQWWLADGGFVGFRVVRDAGSPAAKVK